MNRPQKLGDKCGCGHILVEHDDASIYAGYNAAMTVCVCGLVMCMSCMAWSHEPHDCMKRIRREQGEEAYIRATQWPEQEELIRRDGDWTTL